MSELKRLELVGKRERDERGEREEASDAGDN